MAVYTTILRNIRYEYFNGIIPSIQLKPGCEGTIEKVELYPGSDSIFSPRGELKLPIDGIRRVNLGLGYGRAIPTLEQCTEEELLRMGNLLLRMGNLGLPFGDLEQIRLLEQCLRGTIGNYRYQQVG